MSRGEGMIRRRGNSFQAILYAGIDPVTGKQLYLRGSASTEAEAPRILRGFQSQVAEQRHAKTRASLRTTVESWLETHELEETTGRACPRLRLPDSGSVDPRHRSRDLHAERG